MNRTLLTCGASAFAFLATATPALAQDVDAGTSDTISEDGVGSVESDIVVTGSLVVKDGYRAPTPVTVVTTDELKNSSPSITEALRQLPQLTGSTSASSPTFTPQGNAPSTSDTANLRNLGPTRTLVLLDGRRPPSSGVSGTADISLFPLHLVKRVDIVTGGASAAYGSDAVAGVVNFVLDTKFEGVTAEARSGISDYGDSRSYAFQLSAGLPFAEGRGNLILSGNISGQGGVDGYDRPFTQQWWTAIPNPLFGQPGEPQLLLRPNANLSSATEGGLITSPGALQCTQFDANGNPYPYQRGTLDNGGIEVGGDGARYLTGLVASSKNYSGFGHLGFEFSDNFSVFAEGTYGDSKSDYPNLYPYTYGAGAYTIHADNAYLPQSIRDTMAANDLTSFRLGKLDTNVGRYQAYIHSRTFNIAAGFKARFGGIDIDGYYAHGETRLGMRNSPTRITANAHRAADAVVDPVSNEIVCRVNLTDPTNPCVPYNVFGTQPLTDAQFAYQYFEGYANSIAKQDVAALTLRATPFSSWAGEVVVAAGAEYRAVSGRITSDPIGDSLGFTAGNLRSSAGKYDVKEGFVEVLFPLFKGDSFLKSLDLNGAVRRTDYSSSGAVTTWKIGATSELIDGVILRSTYSQDIRAPNIGDLFGPRVRNNTTIRDPFLNNETYTGVIIATGSNPNLMPEKARTLAVGGSYRPAWLPGFGFSVDYYRIDIKGAISNLSAQNIVDQCFAGNTTLCNQITRSGGFIVNIDAPALNIAELRVSGIDFDASYRTEVGSGDLTLRGIASYLIDYQTVAPGQLTIQEAGTGVRPHLNASLNLSYKIGGTTVSIQERMVGKVHRVTPPVTIDDNNIPATFYTNLGIRQAIPLASGDQVELFANINNLFNQKPRISNTNSLSVGVASQFNASIYDVIGRYYTVGIRGRF